MVRWCLAITALLGVPAAALPQVAPGSGDTLRLDLDAARRLGLERRPQIAAARARWDAAWGRRRQAAGYALNPEVQVKASSLLDPGDGAPIEALFTQPVELAQWGPRRAAAQAGVDAAGAGAADAMRISLYEVDAAFFRAVAAERQWEVRARGDTLSQRLAQGVALQLREGRISQLEANLAEIEAGRARAAARGARRAYLTTMLELRRTLGLPAGQPLRIVGEGVEGPDPAGLDRDSLVTVALATRPDLRAAEALVERWRAEARLAGLSVIPALRLSAVATRGSTAEPLRWGLQVGLPVPLWNRNGGLRDAARGEEAAAEAGRVATELAVRADVAESLEAYRAGREELGIFESQVLGPARANQRMLEIAFEAGRLDLPTVMLLRTRLLDAEAEYWDVWSADRSAYAALQAAVGAVPDRASGR